MRETARSAKLRAVFRALCTLSLAAAVSGCGGSDDPETPDATAEIAQLGGSNVAGEVHFTLLPEGEVRIDVALTGLTPGAHGMHIHEWGDCSAPDGTSAGGHFNPDGVEHGAHDAEVRHAGDLGNVEADANGVATLSRVMDTAFFSLSGGQYDVRGRAVIIHEKADDFGQPLGNAGGRIGCGIVQAATGEVDPVLPPAGS